MTDGTVSSVKNGLGFDLQVTREDGKWKFVLGIKNHDPQGQNLKFLSGQPVDFVIEKDGNRIWAWSAGRMFTQIVQERHIGEGDGLGPFTVWWDQHNLQGQSVPMGQYQLKAYFFGVSRTESVLETKLSI